jgi:hypothetical protein
MWYSPAIYDYFQRDEESGTFKDEAYRRAGYANFIYLMKIFWNQKIYTYHPSFKVDQLAALPRNSKKDPKLTKDLRKLTASFMGRYTASLY